MIILANTVSIQGRQVIFLLLIHNNRSLMTSSKTPWSKSVNSSVRNWDNRGNEWTDPRSFLNCNDFCLQAFNNNNNFQVNTHTYLFHWNFEVFDKRSMAGDWERKNEWLRIVSFTQSGFPSFKWTVVDVGQNWKPRVSINHNILNSAPPKSKGCGLLSCSLPLQHVTHPLSWVPWL